MDLFSQVAAVSIAICAVLTFYTALLHITRKKVSRSHIFRAVRDALVGVQAFQLYFLALDMPTRQPLLLYPLITLLFATGPLNYMRYFMFLYPEKKIPLRVMAQLIPPVLILAWESWFYFFNPSTSQAVLRDIFAHPSHHMITYLILLGVVVTLAQHLMLLQLEIGFINLKETREPVLFSSALLILTMVAILLITAGFLFTHQTVLLAGIFLAGIAGITYLIFENRYPDFYQLVVREDRQKKYKKSLIQGLSRDKIINRLQELMEQEKLYREFEVRLDDVAATLFITPHQLSEFINDCMGMNFTTYINHYRVEEAKNLLLNHPEQSVLSIGFQVGFGSKQSFNSSFKQQTGMTPSEYRKQALPTAPSPLK